MSYSVYLVKNRAGFFLDFEHPSPRGGGRAPMGRWACAHRAVGAEKVGDKNGNNGFANGSAGRKNVKFKRIFHKTPLQNSK